MLTINTLNYVGLRNVSEQTPISLNITTLQGPGYHIRPRVGFGNFLQKIYSNLAGNLLNNKSISCFQVQHCKVMPQNKQIDKQLSRSLCFNFLHCIKKKITRF